MKKKKGLSLEDKRNVLMSLFKKNASFFHYKEIEKHCTQNHISFMIVKDLLGGIVADNLVETEKIGSSAFYWSLPNRVFEAQKKTIEREGNEIENLNKEIESTIKKIEESKKEREETEERKQKIDELNELEDTKKSYIETLKNFESKDPEKYENYLKTTKYLDQLIDFWYDNIFTIQQWMRTKRADIKFENMFPSVKELGLFNDDE